MVTRHLTVSEYEIVVGRATDDELTVNRESSPRAGPLNNLQGEIVVHSAPPAYARPDPVVKAIERHSLKNSACAESSGEYSSTVMATGAPRDSVLAVVGNLAKARKDPAVVDWQPPWLTFTLAVGEFVLVYILAHALKVGLTNIAAVVLFWAAWWMAIWITVAVLPLVSLSWIGNAGEFRSTDWSVAPEYVPLPVTVFPAAAHGSGPPPPARRFSAAAIEIAKGLRRGPGPSRVHAIPAAAKQTA
jgi:hypothetical protein